MCHSGPHHLQTRGERKERGVFTYHKQMQPVAACRRVFHQMTVAKRERISVHDNRADILAGPALLAQRTAVARNALRRVFHQYRVIATAGDRPEAAAGKALLVAGPGARKR